MFRRKRALAILGLVILIPVVGVAWWLLAPLFTSTTVDEEFPFAFNATVPPGMTMDGIEKIMAGMAKVDSEVNESMPDTIAPESPAEAAVKAKLPGKMAAAALEAVRETMDEAMPPDMPQAVKDAMHDLIEDDLPKAVTQAMVKTLKEAEPETASPVKLKTGAFAGADRVHKGSGQASIYRLPDGSHLLRLDDFKVTNGPDLRVILTRVANPGVSGEVTGPGHVELAKLKGNMGNQNYPIPDDVDISSFESVVIYCKPFRVIFSVAPLGNVNKPKAG